MRGEAQYLYWEELRILELGEVVTLDNYDSLTLVLSLSFPRHHGSLLTGPMQCLPGPEHVHVTDMDDK